MHLHKKDTANDKKAKRTVNPFSLTPLALAACGGGESGGSSKVDNDTSTENLSPSKATMRYIDLSNGDFVVVQTDISKISSLSEYDTATISDEILSFDPFDTSPDVVAYPMLWNGSFDLNFDPAGSLNNDVVRAIAIKDIISFDNPNWTSAKRQADNAGDDLHDAFDQIAQNLQQLGIEHATITQWSWGSVNQDGTFSILDPNGFFGPIRNLDLEYFTEAMSELDIEVGMWSQIQAFVTDEGSTFLPESNQENIVKWYDAYAEFVTDRAPFYQDIGITEWKIDCDFCAVGPMYDAIAGGENRQLILQETIDIIDLARTNFFGELTIQNDFNYVFQAPTQENQQLYDLESELLSKVDGVHASLYTSEHTAAKLSKLIENDAATQDVIAMFKEEFSSSILQIQELAQLVDKIYVNIQLQSRSDVFSNPGYLEETGKTSQIQTSDSGFIEVDTSLDVSVQESTQVDFSIQAIYFEAAMQVLQSLNVNAEIIVIAGEYFVPVQIIPDDTYPNLGATIRDKPAEFVVQQWFSEHVPDLETSADFLI